MDVQPVIYLAPFQGITTFTYREVYAKHFPYINKLFTPFYTNVQTAKGVAHKAKELEITHHHHIPVVPQILSKDADEMLRFAVFCGEKGHSEINWNMGCPYPRVAKKQRGSGMLPHPELVERILSGISEKLPIKLSVKCRLGYEDAHEIDALIPLFNAFGVSEVTVHARLGTQLYKGDVDWSSIQSICQKLEMPFVYNGDLFSLADFEQFKQKFPEINRLMIGRGLLTDPLLPAKIKHLQLPELDDQMPLIKHFMEDLYLSYRKQLNDRLQAISILKELWSNLALGFDHPGKVFGRLKKSRNFDEYESAVAAVFNDFQWVGSEAQFLKTLANKGLND